MSSTRSRVVSAALRVLTSSGWAIHVTETRATEGPHAGAESEYAADLLDQAVREHAATLDTTPPTTTPPDDGEMADEYWGDNL